MKHRILKIAAVALALMLCGAALAEVRTTANVWMRSEPNLQGQQITSFPENTSLEYLGETSVDERGVAWYKVSKGDRTGWVSSRYSELLDEQSVVVADATQPEIEEQPAKEDEADEAEIPQPGSDWLTGAEPGDLVEVSGWYRESLLDAASALELTGFRFDANSEIPYQYFDDGLTLAGYDDVEYVGVTGPGWSLFGVALGMDAETAREKLALAGLDAADSFYGLNFEHRGGENSLFVDENGHDSCVTVDIVDDAVAEIHWSTYTG